MAIDYKLTGKALRESIEQEVNRIFAVSDLHHIERRAIVMMIEDAVYDSKLVGIDRGAEIERNASKKTEGV
jgi:hypothetical protein